jgi:multicomponent Na+:H+ antiporter subunit B
MIRRQDSIIITTLTRLLTPFIQLFGLYVIMHGHSSPGGGFQGGVILGAGFILLAISFGIDEARQRFSEGLIAVSGSAGVFIFAGIGLLCLILGANYLDYGILPVAEPRSLGMLGVEIGIGITVMAVMISIFRDLLTFD